MGRPVSLNLFSTYTCLITSCKWDSGHAHMGISSNPCSPGQWYTSSFLAGIGADPTSGEDTVYLTKPITMEEMKFFVKKTIPYRCLPACMAISLCLFAWLAQADEEELRQSMKRSPPKSTKNTPVKSTALAKKPRNQAGDQVLWKQMVLKTTPQKGVSNI